MIKINKLLKHEIESYERLSSLDVKISIIKIAIMTIPYNATWPRTIKYLKEQFEYDNEKNMSEPNLIEYADDLNSVDDYDKKK